MGDLILDLIPVALGITLGPLAVMALGAVLVSRMARANGAAYLIGWAVAVVGVLLFGLWLFSVLAVHARADPPLWANLVRIVLALLLIGTAVWVYRRGGGRAKAMAAATTPEDVVEAAPQLPGWLRAVSTFRPMRSGFLGFGIFALNPVNLSCALIAALDISLAILDTIGTTWVVVGLCLVSILPIAVPVSYVLARGARAPSGLDRIRDWIAGHTGLMNAALLLVIGVLQLQKGISGLL